MTIYFVQWPCEPPVTVTAETLNLAVREKDKAKAFILTLISAALQFFETCFDSN